MGHISHHVPGVEFSTGSLGHGLPVAVGMALAARRARAARRVFCLMSDGDCDEGSTWEAIMFAAQHKFDNLTVIVDYNRVQALGTWKTSSSSNRSPRDVGLRLGRPRDRRPRLPGDRVRPEPAAAGAGQTVVHHRGRPRARASSGWKIPFPVIIATRATSSSPSAGQVGADA